MQVSLVAGGKDGKFGHDALVKWPRFPLYWHSFYASAEWQQTDSDRGGTMVVALKGVHGFSYDSLVDSLGSWPCS